jgi:23S rRNA pseudouridine1911/1915/1917 synthase
VKTEDSSEDGGYIEPVDLPLSIAYEDNDLVVPDKPSNMPTHPSCGHYGDTVANALAFRYKDSGNFVFRPVNRLDRDTSGLLVIARNRLSAARLTESMRQKKIKKKYIAFLCGVVEEDCGVIDTYMRRTAESIIVREVCEKQDGADHALTKFKVLHRGRAHTVVLAEPITGRTHQLRVHFSSIGHPIVGDGLYGSLSEDICRQALHAAYLSFEHPTTGQTMELYSPLFEDMSCLLEKYFDIRELKYDF